MAEPVGRETGRRVRLGVMGCADIAWRRTLPAAAAIPGVELVAVSSRDGTKAEQFAERFGCAAVTGYQRLLEREDIDAVYVPLPVALRRKWVGSALAAGKHVLSEKPLATGTAGAAELVALAERHGRVLMENFTFPHHSQHDAVRAMLQAGEIGPLRLFTSEFGVPPRDPDDIRYDPELGGSALLDVGVYPLRLAQLFFGPQLRVRGAVLRHDERTGVDLSGGALLSTPDGTAVHVGFGIGLHYHNTYTLWGAEGTLTVDRAFTPPEALRPVARVHRQNGDQATELDADNQYRNAVAVFASAVAAGRAGAPDTVMELAALIDTVREAARAGAEGRIGGR